MSNARTYGTIHSEQKPFVIQHADSTDYLLGGSLVMKNGKIDKVLFDGGYAQASVATKTTDKFAFNFYNQDHLGNNREVVDAKGVVQQFTIYEFDLAPYQADKQKAVKGVTTVQIHDKQDLVATPIPIEGADAYLLNLMSQEVRFHTLLITLCFGTK